MKKTATTTYQINNLISERWSPRSFKDQEVTDQEIGSLFEAARWAASSMNEQPWRFIYAKKGEEAFDKITKALMDGNAWAAQAPLLIATVIRTTMTRNGKPNGSALHDLGLAVGNLSIQATELELSLHQMGGIYPEVIEEEFNLGDDYKAVTLIALGHAGEADQLESPLKERELAERNRKPLNEIAFHGRFGA